MSKLDDLTVKLTDELTKEGKLIAAGFLGFQQMVINKEASQVQRDEMRLAFFAGAQHLFASIMSILDPGDEEPTAADLARMDQIEKELRAFAATFAQRHYPTKGTA